jgi:hypothetical protein
VKYSFSNLFTSSSEEGDEAGDDDDDEEEKDTDEEEVEDEEADLDAEADANVVGGSADEEAVLTGMSISEDGGIAVCDGAVAGKSSDRWWKSSRRRRSPFEQRGFSHVNVWTISDWKTASVGSS